MTPSWGRENDNLFNSVQSLNTSKLSCLGVETFVFFGVAEATIDVSKVIKMKISKNLLSCLFADFRVFALIFVSLRRFLCVFTCFLFFSLVFADFRVCSLIFVSTSQTIFCLHCCSLIILLYKVSVEIL